MIDSRLEGTSIGLEGNYEKVLVLNSSLEGARAEVKGASLELGGASETVETINTTLPDPPRGLVGPARPSSPTAPRPFGRFHHKSIMYDEGIESKTSSRDSWSPKSMAEELSSASSSQR